MLPSVNERTRIRAGSRITGSARRIFERCTKANAANSTAAGTSASSAPSAIGSCGGYQLFKSYGCVTCHQGANVGGNMFQRFGIFPRLDATTPADPAGTRSPGAARSRRVPGAEPAQRRRDRAVLPRRPGGDARAAVDTMAGVQLGRTLAPEEIELIVQFLRTLTGEYRAPLGAPGTADGDRR